MQLNQLAMIGLSYRTAPIGVREQLSHGWRAFQPTLMAAGGNTAVPPTENRPPIEEWALLATCNRLELYTAVSPDTHTSSSPALSLLTHFLAQITAVDTTQLQPHLYHHTGTAVAEHLARVAAGLDSLALGEPQILGQVADTFTTATTYKTSGPLLTELFRTAIRVGKRARAETRISHHSSSMSALAATQAQSLLGDLTHRRHLIIGLGEMGRLALKALQARGATNIALANRTPERIAHLAAAQGLPRYRLDQLPEALAQADVVIIATAAPDPLITPATIHAARQLSPIPPAPLLLIDLALPRNVDPAVRDLPHLHLWDADQLQSRLDEALTARQQQIPHVEAIIATEIATFLNTLPQLTMRPLITDLRHKAEAIRQQEIARTLRYLGDVDPATLTQLEHFSRALVNKLLHEPTRHLRAKAAADEAPLYAQTTRELFGLGPV